MSLKGKQDIWIGYGQSNWFFLGHKCNNGLAWVESDGRNVWYAWDNVYY